MSLLSSALGLLVGLALGLLGGGGSILCVPIFVYVLGLPAREAIAGSLLVVGVTAAVGALRHHRHGRVRGRIALLFGPVAMAGAFVGARVGTQMSGGGQLTLFALTMLAAAVFMAREEPPGGPTRRPTSVVAVSALGVGVLTGLVGVGGGFLIVPALVLLLGVPMKEAVGTSLLVIVMNALAGFAGYLGEVTLPWASLGVFGGFTVAGILVGVRLVSSVPQAALRRGFSAFLVAMAAFILWQNRSVLRGVAGDPGSAAAPVAAPPAPSADAAPETPRWAAAGRAPARQRVRHAARFLLLGEGGGPVRPGRPTRHEHDRKERWTTMARKVDGGIQEKDTAPDPSSGKEPSRERIRELAEEMREMGWSGSPLVVHGDQVLSGAERYEAARFLGREKEVPRVTLDEVFAEAGLDMPQIASPEGGPPSDEQFFEDYLRDLPEHIRDKYEI